MIFPSLPDKWIRKAIYDGFNGSDVDGDTINVYDSRITGPSIPNIYVLLSIQSNAPDKSTKCNYSWRSNIRLEVVNTVTATGNQGSRLKADNVADALLTFLNAGVDLDIASGLKSLSQNIEFQTDITTPTENKIIYRKIISFTMFVV